MRKIIAATTVGLLLVAGQAAAANMNSAVNRVGDRVGARAKAGNEFANMPVGVLIIGGAVTIAAVTIALDDDSRSE